MSPIPTKTKPDPRLCQPTTSYDIGRFADGYWAPVIENGTGRWLVAKRPKTPSGRTSCRVMVFAVDDQGFICKFREYKSAYFAAARRDADDWLTKTTTEPHP